MLKNCNKILIAIFLVVLPLEGKTKIIPFKKNQNAIIQEYLKLHKTFFKEHCKPGSEHEFNKLEKLFKGNGLYIPQLPDESLDSLTINRFIPELKRKKQWIEKQIVVLKKVPNFRTHLNEIQDLKKGLEKLLKYKQIFNEDEKNLNRNQARNESKYYYIEYKAKLESFIEKISFLHSYRFPNDHLDLRKSYDEFKSREDLQGKRRANEIYFYRKIVQDGAQNKNHTRLDRFFRAGLDTLVLRLQENEDIISEITRYDLDNTLNVIEKYLRRGKRRLISRLEEWSGRTDRAIEFYESLKRNKVSQKGQKEITALELVQGKSRARYTFKEYVLEKEAKVYDFWRNKSELMQALYSIETILYNEVGGIDGRDALERRDVTQVVINRTRMPRYATIDSRESLFPYLANVLGIEGKSTIVSNKWLNVLFKEGQFSFTYFFISGSLRIYCPSQNRRAKFLRKENLRIALELLEKPNDGFRAVRYFSRSAMTGRYNMDSLWSEYAPLPERLGKIATRQRYLKRQFEKGNYAYRYNFEDENKLKYRVIKISNSEYVMPVKGGKFYKYRSPHHFRYFEEIPSK